MPQQIANTGQLLVITTPAAPLAAQITQLAHAGHQLQLAHDQAQALAQALAQPPDLILLEVPIPGLDGLALLDALQAQPVLQQIPVVVLTGIPDPQRLLRAFDAGVVDYIAKPCTDAELLARVQVHLRLKLTRDRLERVARERQELVNLVAHDLKNPLTSVLFASEMLALPDCRPERAPRYLQIIEDSTREALGYIRSYLESQHRPDPGDAHAAPACSHLGDAVDWLAARYELQLEANGVQLRIDRASADACVAIPGQVLRQVGENLVSNALKYARAGGELELAVRAGAPGTWQLLAQDRGPGVPASFLPQLFQPFQRLQAPTAEPLSSGLGLALARQIAVNAGGRLWYEDREGGGARFLLELPRADCHCG